MKRFTGTGDAPLALDSVLHEDLPSLLGARRIEDQRIINWLDAVDEPSLAANFTYMAITQPIEIRQPLWSGLSHFFNHQTHHRGQCHMTLTALGKASLGLDLAYYLRADGKRWLDN